MGFIRSILRINHVLFGVGMFENVIIDQNPHWDGTLYREGVAREVLGKIQSGLALPHIISIVGVRRCGKSTLIRQMINHLMKDKEVKPRNILFLNLEHPGFSRYKNDVNYLERVYEDYLKLTSPREMIYCFLDEVQFFKEWQVFVKSHYERKKVKFIVTGSNSRLLSSEFITLLSGRTIPVEVYPFSFSEFIRAKGGQYSDRVSFLKNRHVIRGFLDDFLRDGGFPEIAFIDEKETKKDILAMYARTILYQDIAARFGVKKAVDLENLFFYLASNISSLYSYNSLSKLMGLTDKTIKEYLSYFADAYLLFTVNAFSFSVKQQLKSSKKVYTVDVGLADAVSFRFSDDRGKFLENMIYLELKRRGKELFYYKTANGLEVDFIGKTGLAITDLIQVSRDLRDEKTKNREVRALIKAMDETGVENGLIVTQEEEGEIKKGGKTVTILPAYKFLLNVNGERE